MLLTILFRRVDKISLAPILTILLRRVETKSKDLIAALDACYKLTLHDLHVESYDVGAGVWLSGLARWLVDFVLAVVGSNPSHG